MSHRTSTSPHSIDVRFEYNEDGLRTKKTVLDEVTHVETVTEYTLHGKNIVHLKQGSNSLHFYYDAQNRPAIVEWNNGTTTASYAYIYNLQGDVIALTDSAGVKVVGYTYDAWGKPLSTTGSLRTTLGKLNPFLYRGYVYDDEIDFYYLRSRYYNANRGRFINADSVLDGKNIYEYCNNSPCAMIDYDGNDAYWLTDTGNVATMGHTSLLLQNDDGAWYYFYWGPEPNTMPLRTQARVQLMKVDVKFDKRGMLDLDSLNESIKGIYKRGYNKASLYRGDYSRSISYAQLLIHTYENQNSFFNDAPAYGVLMSNCMQASAMVMQASNPIYENPIAYLHFASLCMYVVPSVVARLLEISGFPTVHTSTNSGAGIDIPR